MKTLPKSIRKRIPVHGTTLVLIALANFATSAYAANAYEGGLGIERQKVERPQGGQAERRPDRQVAQPRVASPRERQVERRQDRRMERHVDRQQDRRINRIERHQERRVYRPPVWRGDIRHFDRHDFPRWRAGDWRHARHQGRLGWWWVVGGSWYFYSQPVYPYPDPYTPHYYTQPEPQVVVIEQEREAPPPEIVVAPPVASQSWYFCVSTQGYYPYTTSCPEGWVSVPATPEPAR